MTQGISEQREQVTALYLDQQDRVGRLVARALRTEDRQLADDLAQDVWVTYWQYALRGNTIDSPAALLATMARHRVCDHYRSARVRREGITDFSDDAQACRLPAVPAAEDVAVGNLAVADALRAARPVRRAVRTALRTFRHTVRTGVAA